MKIYSSLILLLALIILFPSILSAQPSIPVYNMDIVDTFPHSITDFTQGLVVYNGYLYESIGQYGSSAIKKIDISTGEVLQQANLEKDYFGEGITILEGKIYQLTWRSHKGFIYDLNTFEKTGDFFITTEGWGLTTDGTYLIQSDGTEKIYFLNPATMKVEKTIYAWSELGPLQGINELEWYKGDLLANIYPTSVIARINVETGEVENWIVGDDLLESEDIHDDIDVLNGIAYDNTTDQLYITGKNWPKLFRVELYER